MSDASPSSDVPRIPGLRESAPGAAYKRGDVIGRKYEVHGVLGAGGFGIVYLVYHHEHRRVYALKTFRDEYLADAEARERFRKEASVWVDLERHPYLVRAYWVEGIAFRLFIAMEYIAPDEHGLNTLEGYLRRRPPDLAQSLRWAIQLCYGMEYVYSKGIRCHRDIKPANIMIGLGKSVKITDFGLAGTLGIPRTVSGIRLSIQQGTVGLSGQTMEGTGFGTPPHMPPEQFTDAASCDERSDIYSFGVVLFQMASGGRLPFLAPLPTVAESETARFWREMHRLHATSPVPKLNSPLFSIIQRCMEKEPDRRYQSFKELRGDLEPLLKRLNGETVRLPEQAALEAWEWSNKGISLASLFRYEEAIRCYDRVLELDPRNANAWNNKGNSLDSLVRYEDAIRCYDRVLELDPRYATAWYNKSASLHNLGRYEEAVCCCDKALELDPRYATAWYEKGISLSDLRRHEEAIHCFDEALELDPRDARTWSNKGSSLDALGRHEEAVRCWEKILEVRPWFADAWNSKGNSLGSLGRHEEAIRCYDKALERDQRDERIWHNKGNSLRSLGRHEEAIRCYDKALELDRQFALVWCDKALELDRRYAMDWYTKALAQDKLGRRQDAVLSYKQFIALGPTQYVKQLEYAQQRVRELELLEAREWLNKGNSLHSLGCYEEAIRCCDKALELDPQDAAAWSNKGFSLYSLGRHEEAIRCFDKALELDPQRPLDWCSKGTSFRRLGRHEEAIRCFDKALELDPQRSLDWCSKGICLNHLGRYEEAIRCCDKALELDPRFATAWSNKGFSLDSLGRHGEAIRYFDKALELDPRDATVWLDKGLAQDKAGRRQEAVRTYKQFIALAPTQCEEQVEDAKQRVQKLEGGQ